MQINNQIGGILELSHFLAEFQYVHFTQRLLTAQVKTAKNVFFPVLLPFFNHPV